jgi:hypothetical protein
VGAQKIRHIRCVLAGASVFPRAVGVRIRAPDC